MAQNFPTDAGVLIKPGAYAQYSVVQQNTGLATSGILMLVGEADAGPDYSQEDDLASNFFGPGQISNVKAKYKTGRLVDAFNGAAVPANDPQIQGAPAGFILVKTNPSTKADATLARWDATDYATLQDRNYGKLGNLISYEVTEEVAEVVPTTGAFAFMLPIASTNISVRVNGGAALPLTLAALETPATFAAALGGLAGVDTTGGADVGILSTTTGTLALTVIAGNRVQIDRSVAFDALPVAGDTLFIPASTPLSSIATNNAGSYIVTGATSTQVLATKLLDASGSPAALTPPTSQGAIAIVAATDLKAYGAITATLIQSIDPIDGYGKNLQVDELTSGTGVLSTLLWKLNNSGTPVVVSFVSKTSAPVLVSSGAEYQATLTESRSLDGVTNDITAGGAVALKLGYVGTTGSAVINDTTITITTTGGASAGTLTATLADWPTIGDLAAYINSFAGFTCVAGTAVLGSQPSTSLDQGTFGICSTFSGLTPGRIKQDAYKFFTTLRDNGFLTELDAQADSGLPAPTAGVAFLTGGTKGATTDAIVSAAIDALRLVRGNFLVPLFSRDAADDIADNLTDASSTYTIEAVHSAARTHVLQMSTLKKRRNRQAFLSLRAALDDVKEASGELASFRCSLNFQDVRDRSTATGGIVQFQPWMGSCKAAGMQAAGFYRAIFNKGINISGVIQAAGDFNDGDDEAIEQALLAGLLIIERPDTGGFKWVSDQTTYGKDNNFVYNSIQATYVSDVISMTTAQLMEQAFVGQSLADISASAALSVLDSIMDNYRRLKLITFSDDAPKGYKNASVRITGPAMVVSAEVKVATALYFIPIAFQITQVQQSA